MDDKTISVVIQGTTDKKLTPLCIKSIRKYLPNAEIILSTWEGCNVSGLDYDILVLNKDPGGYVFNISFHNKSNSLNNFNRQLISTRNGIEKVSNKYCLKLRSDLVLNNSNFLKYWDEFDKQNEEFKIFKHRVICSSIYSREYSCQSGTGLPTPFHPSDFWFFGLTDDLKDYFENCPIQTLNEAGNWAFKYPNRLPYDSMLWRFAPEQFFCINWVKKYYPNIQFDDWSDWNTENIEFSNKILYNNFVFLDYEQAGIYSIKHKWAYENQDTIQGLITFYHFQKQYQLYCDKLYIPIKQRKNYRHKLNQHFKRLMQPFFATKEWIGEIFSVLYYLLAVIITVL